MSSPAPSSARYSHERLDAIDEVMRCHGRQIRHHQPALSSLGGTALSRPPWRPAGCAQRRDQEGTRSTNGNPWNKEHQCQAIPVQNDVLIYININSIDADPLCVYYQPSSMACTSSYRLHCRFVPSFGSAAVADPALPALGLPLVAALVALGAALAARARRTKA